MRASSLPSCLRTNGAALQTNEVVRDRAPSLPGRPGLRSESAALNSDAFVMTLLLSVSMDKEWASAFGDVGITESTLRRFAKLPRIHFEEFLAEQFPSMKRGDRLILEDALYECCGSE